MSISFDFLFGTQAQVLYNAEALKSQTWGPLLIQPQKPAISAQYTFGTHAEAIYNQEALKTQIWRSSQGVLSKVLGAQIFAPAQIPPQLASFIFPSAAPLPPPSLGRALGRLGPDTLGSPLLYPHLPPAYTRPVIRKIGVKTTVFQIVSPQWLSLKEWADAFVHVNAIIIILPQLMDKRDFNRWAAEVVQNPVFSGLNLPYPEGEDWRHWALEINQVLSIASQQ